VSGSPPDARGPRDAPGPSGPPTRILFVCLGNICRSPTAEGVMRSLVEEQGLDGAIELDSAGTGGWHVGSPPDARATAAAAARGIALSGAARQVSGEDFERFDLILAMDRANERSLLRLAPDENARAKVGLLRRHDPAAGPASDPASDPAPGEDLDVPDPYYGGPHGFEHVLDLIGAACAGLLAEVRRRSSL